MVPLLVKKGKRLGKLLFYAFFGSSGGREIWEPLRIVIGLDCTLGMV